MSHTPLQDQVIGLARDSHGAPVPETEATVVSVPQGGRRYLVRVHGAPGQSQGAFYIDCSTVARCYRADGSFDQERFRAEIGLLRQFGRADPQKDLRYVTIVEVDDKSPPFLRKTVGPQTRDNINGRTVENLPGGATEYVILRDDQCIRSPKQRTMLDLNDPRTREILQKGADLEKHSPLRTHGQGRILDGKGVNPEVRSALDLSRREAQFRLRHLTPAERIEREHTKGQDAVPVPDARRHKVHLP
ncbi:MAG: hypothetical protein IPK85_05290 [Gemmatimonadetes bacterium]|nr:hypothetical protein [Gemmatimonadota bacterium]